MRGDVQNDEAEKLLQHITTSVFEHIIWGLSVTKMGNFSTSQMILFLFD